MAGDGEVVDKFCTVDSATALERSKPDKYLSETAENERTSGTRRDVARCPSKASRK